ncbi:MAG: MATE family efflux transporter, partial [Planctomycetota bacterium]
AGDMRTPLYVLGGLNVVNVFASMVFVYGPPPAFGFDFIGFGPVGIIYGTIVAKLLGAAAILGVLASHRSPALRLVPRWMRPDRRAIARVLKIGLPAAAEGLVMWVGQFVFLGLVATVGRRAGVSEDVEADARAFIAAHFVGIRVEGISYLPAFAWGAAAATMTGQAIGAGRPKLGVTAGHIAAGQASVLGAVLSLVFVFGADAIFAVMHDDPQVRAVGAPALRMIGFFQIPLVLAIVYVQALRGAGDTRWPLAMTVSGVYGLRLPLAYLGGMYWVGGLVGVWVGMAVDIAARAIVAAVRYRGEAWTRTRV